MRQSALRARVNLRATSVAPFARINQSPRKTLEASATRRHAAPRRWPSGPDVCANTVEPSRSPGGIRGFSVSVTIFRINVFLLRSRIRGADKRSRFKPACQPAPGPFEIHPSVAPRRPLLDTRHIQKAQPGAFTVDVSPLAFRYKVPFGGGISNCSRPTRGGGGNHGETPFARPSHPPAQK